MNFIKYGMAMKDKIAQLMSQSAYNKPQQQEAFTMDKLKDIIASMYKPSNCCMQFPYSNIGFYQFNEYEKEPINIKQSLHGFNIHESNHLPEETVPKFQLSEKVIVSDEFRYEMNKWLLDFFGTKKVSKAYMIGNHLVVNPNIKAVINTNMV
jgi:hypothetical protein